MKLKTFNQLKREFDKNVKELQEKCPHKKTHWAKECWAIGHATGYEVKVCDKCYKIINKKCII